MKKYIKKILEFNKWFFFFFLKQPRKDLYMKKMNNLNINFYNSVLHDKSQHKDSFLAQYQYKPIPKKIWIYWAQGETNAPYIVKKCIESWRIHNTSWNINILDDNNIENFITLSDLPSFLPTVKKSDFIRLRLLKKYGGVWVDATTLCHRKIDSWLPFLCTNGFFIFRNGGPDRFIESWFIASTPLHKLITTWEKSITNYTKNTNRLPFFYFWTFYLFQWEILNHKDLQDEFNRSAGYPAPPTFKLMAYIDGRIKYNDFKAYLKSGLPLSKLDWRCKKNKKELEEIFLNIHF